MILANLTFGDGCVATFYDDGSVRVANGPDSTHISEANLAMFIAHQAAIISKGQDENSATWGTSADHTPGA